jgi:RAB protein geranylgeranyltransferase component A
MSRACAALSDFDFFSDDSCSLKEDEKVKHKQADFTSLCLMEKSYRNISDSDISDDLSPRVFLSESSSLKMLCAIRISCFARFFMRIKS